MTSWPLVVMVEVSGFIVLGGLSEIRILAIEK